MLHIEYLAPRDIGQVCALLREYSATAKLLAGGTDLVVQMRAGKYRPGHLIGLSNLPLRSITYEEQTNTVTIGALATHNELSGNPLVREKLPALATASGSVGGRQTRNLGTIGGNICNASPAADTPPALIILDAGVRIAGPDGTRTMPVAEFFTEPGKTALNAGEFVTHLDIPVPRAGTAAVFLKEGVRKVMEIATVNVAALVGVLVERALHRAVAAAKARRES